MAGKGIYGVHYKDVITAEDVLSPRDSRFGQKSQRFHHVPDQKQVIKQQLHDQNVSLRTAFVRHDVRLTGACPGYAVAHLCKAGGLELSKSQVVQAREAFKTGDGQFNWDLFCESVDGARKKSWDPKSLKKQAQTFKEMDADDSGLLSRTELRMALRANRSNLNDDQVEKIIDACDGDGDGNISYPEFLDGLAREMVTPTSVFGHISTAYKGPKRQ
mmetsp:Transcript_11372/g.29108  ORF Transcript_11372/g.29108 Transcript_11372/m.29108 type:complete len:216 (+) Transcript_11372:39-686(+)